MFQNLIAVRKNKLAQVVTT